MKNIFSIFVKHFIITGFITAIVLTILEIISLNNKHVELYAFASGSFFIINLVQFYIVNKKNYNATPEFLIQSILGGIVWVLYSIIIYLLYLNKFSLSSNIILTSIFIVIVLIIHYYLVQNNYFNYLYKNIIS